MSVGLIALLDDITAIAKVIAASLDDAATQAAKAGSKVVSKAAGIVIDDAAVTPRYVVGLAAKRELPIIGKIALGSIKNKLLFLLPGALLLSYFAPLVITPLLMIGGAYLCFEGWHKVADLIGLHKDDLPLDSLHHAEEVSGISISERGLSSLQLEDQRVNSAVRTDFILSAEIMAITLSTVATSPLWLQGVVLAFSGLGMTIIVYGAVALIVKADDFGAYLALKSSAFLRLIGRGIVFGMPIFLEVLTHVGMLAMLWVGGGIIVHGLHVLGIHGPEESINKVGLSVISFLGGFGAWIVKAIIFGSIGLVIGAIVDPFSSKVLNPLIRLIKKALGKND